MDAEASSSSSSPSLRHKLRLTVCCCFWASGDGERRGAGDSRVRWRRPVAAREFGYDPLSYALNFDEGGDDEYGDSDAAAAFRYRSFSSRLPPSPAPAQRPTAIA